jgi:hypothetical protein
VTHSSAIDPATLLAYQQSEYRVFGTVPAILRVGVPCAELVILHEANQTDRSAFITACNPLGEVLNDAVNIRRQQALAAELSRQGLLMIPGVGQHPAGAWPGEPSYLIFGVTRTATQELGRQFEQNAILWSGADAVPELILLR